MPASMTALNGGTILENFIWPTISQSTNQTTSERSILIRIAGGSPDLVDGVEVAAVAADLVRTLRAIDCRAHNLRHAPRARREGAIWSESTRPPRSSASRRSPFSMVAQEVEVSWNLRRVCSSTERSSSSMRMMSASTVSARASPTRWRMPPELRRVAVLETLQAHLGDVLSRNFVAFFFLLRVAPGRSPRSSARLPTATARNPERRTPLGPGPCTALPFTRTSPPFFGIRPAMILRSVVLPQPLGPSSVESWPFGNDRSTSRSASTHVVVVAHAARLRRSWKPSALEALEKVERARREARRSTRWPRTFPDSRRPGCCR